MNICLFSGSAAPHSAEVEQAARTFCKWCAENGHTMVNGGTGYGLMNVLGDATLACGGKVIAIYPGEGTAHALQRHNNLTHKQVRNLHERLEVMTDISDCFVAFPGGIGTLHEIFQVWADSTLAFHKKPLHILNLDGFFNPLKALIDHTQLAGYTSPQRAAIATWHPTLASLTTALSA